MVSGLTVLDEIIAAEEAGRESQKEAVVTARNLVTKAETEATAEGERLIARARKEAANLILEAENAAKLKAKAMVAERTLSDRQAVARAERNLPQAIAYIVEKVVI